MLDSTVKDRIKEIRRTMGLSQREFADRIHVSTSHLAGMELGDKAVNERTALLICFVYGVDEHWLKTGEGTIFSGGNDQNTVKAMELYKSLHPRFREYAFKQLEELVELYHSYEDG
jgi:transcriptional regulator with XRE-family HTH domain